MKTTASSETMCAALAAIREKYPTVDFNRYERRGKYIHFTLKAKSGAPGSRNSYSGRRGPWAAWHVHGLLFDKVFELEPGAVIYSMGEKQKPGEWKDRQIGSFVAPVLMSETDNL